MFPIIYSFLEYFAQIQALLLLTQSRRLPHDIFNILYFEIGSLQFNGLAYDYFAKNVSTLKDYSFVKFKHSIR